MTNSFIHEYLIRMHFLGPHKKKKNMYHFTYRFSDLKIQVARCDFNFLSKHINVFKKLCATSLS